MSMIALWVYARLTEQTKTALAGADPFAVIEDISHALTMVGRRYNGAPIKRNAQVHGIVRRVALETGEPESLIYSRSHEAQLVRARHVAWQQCRSDGLSYSAIARAFGVHHTSVLSACKKQAKLGVSG